jgi:peptidoglycan/LPS O-acetylase OafA/YrhL
MPYLDGMRGLAVLAVIVYHGMPNLVPGGFFGVDVFFVLSGFLITLLLLREYDKTGRINLKNFYMRRALRLLPALVLLLCAYLVVSAILGWNLAERIRDTLLVIRCW